MLNHGKRHGRIRRQLFQQFRKRLQPACRGPYANYDQFFVVWIQLRRFAEHLRPLPFRISPSQVLRERVAWR